MWISALYALGVLAAVFHFSNGLWTLGITWGIWTSPAAMRRANFVSIAVGVVLAAAGLGAISGMRNIDVEQARATEEWMEKQKEKLSPPGASPMLPTALKSKGE